MRKLDIYHISVVSDAAADIVAPYFGGLPSYSFGIGPAIVVMQQDAGLPAPTVDDKIAQHVLGVTHTFTVEVEDERVDAQREDDVL